uniref:Uncharacterized protein n=1 Tax=Castor canadensis TaxID=51338 RepID=A0A8C0ZRI4_CASCN
MSEGAAAASPPGAASAAAASAEEGIAAAAAAAAAGGGPDGGGEGAAEPPRELRCSDCIVWNRQQTWLCVVPLFIGFIGLGLSLMLLKWIVVGSVKEYVPTDLVDSKGMGQDPFFLSKPSSFPKAMETTTTTTSTTSPATSSVGGAASSRTPNRISTRLTTITRAPTRFPGHRVPIRASPRSTTARNTAAPPTVLSTTAPFFSSSTPGSRPPVPGAPSTQAMPSWPTAAYATSSYLHDSTPSWTLSPFQDAAASSSFSSSSSSSSSSSTTTTTPESSTSPKFRKLLSANLASVLWTDKAFASACVSIFNGLKIGVFLSKRPQIFFIPSDAVDMNNGVWVYFPTLAVCVCVCVHARVRLWGGHCTWWGHFMFFLN